MNDRQFMLSCLLLLSAACVTLVLGGCAISRDVGAASGSGVRALVDPPPERVRDSLCDFGILRGTSSMRCVDEFKRKEWLDGLV